MPGEAVDTLANLPPWMQGVAQIVTVLGIGAYGVWQYVLSRRKEKDKAGPDEHDPFDPDELLGASPLVKFFANVEEIAINAKLQTEALRNVSAVATQIGTLLQSDYSELRVFRAVQDALDRERRTRGRAD